MSTRRRRSELTLHEDAEEIAGLQLQHFADFKRRHARQNREIISDNINRNKLIRTLQDQVTTLQSEVLQVRRQYSLMQRRMAAMQVERSAQEGAVEALSHILNAVPALQHLRDTLALTQGPGFAPPPVTAMSTHNYFNPTATRPAATAGECRDLQTLGEVAEEHSPEPTRRRRQFTAHSPARRLLFQEGSSSPRRSPSPKRTPPKSRARRRRESGLLIPPRTLSPSPSPEEGATEELAPPRQELEESGASWDDGELVPIEPLEVQAILEEDAVEVAVTPKKHRKYRKAVPSLNTTLTVKDLAAGYEAQIAAEKVSTPNSATSSTSASSSPALSPAMLSTPVVRSIPASKLQDEILDDDAVSRSSSLSPPPDSPPPAVVEIEAEDENGRTRRSRASVVSYKEPSLRKKMRKPDGAAVDDVLGVLNRPEATATGVRRKSALPRSTAKILLAEDKDRLVDAISTSNSAHSGLSPSSSPTFPPKSTIPTLKDKSRRASPPSAVPIRAALADVETPNTVVISARKVSTASAAEKRRRSAAV